MRTSSFLPPIIRSVAFGLSLLMASCGSDQESDISGQFPTGESVAMRVGSARLSGKSIDTRAGDESGTTVTSDKAELRLFRTTAGGYTPAMYDVKSIYNAAEGQWISENPIYVDSRKATVYACYDPNNVVTFGANSTTTTSTISFGDKDDDKMWYFDNSHTAIDCTNPEPDFTLKCVYSLLAFNIARDINYLDACKISDISIRPTTGSFLNVAKFDLSSGTVTGGSSLAAYTKDTKSLPMYTVGISAVTPDTDVELMVPSQPLPTGSGMKITLTVDGDAQSVTIPNATFNEFKNSERYTVYLKITPVGLDVTKVELEDWEEKDLAGTGDKPFETEPK